MYRFSSDYIGTMKKERKKEDRGRFPDYYAWSDKSPARKIRVFTRGRRRSWGILCIFFFFFSKGIEKNHPSKRMIGIPPKKKP